MMYLVLQTMDGDPCDPRFMTAAEIFNRMDMSDTFPFEHDMRLFICSGIEDPVEVFFHGTWHNFDDPLLMTITAASGEVLDAAHGTDH